MNYYHRPCRTLPSSLCGPITIVALLILFTQSGFAALGDVALFSSERRQLRMSANGDAPVLPSQTAQQKRLFLQLADSKIEVFEHFSPVTSQLVFFAPHDSERTCVAAAIEAVNRYGGHIFQIKSNGNRFLNSFSNGKPFSVDPNRIFTEAGITKTVSGAAPRDEVAALVSGFSTNLVKTIGADSHRWIIALHNNTDGKPLDVHSYRPGQTLSKAALEVHSNPELDSDDFFLTTSALAYEKLGKAGYNVVLQDNLKVPDDGSLSVYCGQRHINYINIEAEAGHRSQQLRMIEAVEALGRSGPIPPPLVEPLRGTMAAQPNTAKTTSTEINNMNKKSRVSDANHAHKVATSKDAKLNATPEKTGSNSSKIFSSVPNFTRPPSKSPPLPRKKGQS